jgi:hypothetical protein
VGRNVFFVLGKIAKQKKHKPEESQSSKDFSRWIIPKIVFKKIDLIIGIYGEFRPINQISI